MLFFIVLFVFCMTIVQPPIVHAELTEADHVILHAMNLDPKAVMGVDLVTVKFPRKSVEDYKMNGTFMSIQGPGADFDLNLHHRDSMLISTKTPVYLVYKNSNKSGGVEYVLQPNAMAKVGLLLEDSLHRASVLFGINETKEFTITAVVGGRTSTTGMIIKSLPIDLAEYAKKRRSIDDNFLDDNNDEGAVNGDYKNDPDDDLNSFSIRAVAARLKSTSGLGNIITRGKREILEKSEIHDVNDYSEEDDFPDPGSALYPKVLLAADCSYHRNWSPADFVHSLEYLLALLNTIDIYLRHLEDPIIKIHITAITIATSPEATPYIEENILGPKKMFHQSRAINSMARYFHRVQDQLPIDYHIAFSLTQLRMMGNVKGASRFGGVCTSSEEEMNGVVLVTDNGLFGEIEAAVHEFGHVFGLPDDKPDDPDNCSHQFGAYAEFIQCPKQLSYIMAPLSVADREPTFSDLSLDSFDELLKTEALSCMYEKPVEDSVVVPESLPTTVLSLTEQCQERQKSGPCPGYEANMCTRLRCLERDLPFGNETVTLCMAFYHGAARGTPCTVYGERHPGVCHHNRCVSV